MSTRITKINSRAELDRIVENILNDADKLKCLTEKIETYYESKKDTSGQFNEMLSELGQNLNTDEIRSIFIRNGLLYSHFVVFGSSATHLRTTDSDVDICIVVKSLTGQPLTMKARKKMMNELLNELHFCYEFKEKWSYPNAKVPVFGGKNELFKADFVIHDKDTVPPSLLASILINAYCQIEPNLAPLCVYLKKWCEQFMKQNQEKKLLLKSIPNSYTIVLMAIHMLQIQQLLPNLIRWNHGVFDINTTNWERISHFNYYSPLSQFQIQKLQDTMLFKKLSVGEMAIKFFETYSIFDASKEKIIMRTGQWIKTRRPLSRFTIVDDYDKNSPSRRVKNVHHMKALFGKFLITTYNSNASEVYDNSLDISFEL